ncbi:alpha-1A adrenergic receptor-like [Patiria miniata]|uniref:G-protein coupled receptors family 1 profile domain-containing protein n=1 Tax=Patiria miniata TaxID=46514 RepID=A0A914B195_PATMI|nr:alpha-1A adrenergic receptor-like [Patiria miniata]
MDDVNSTIAILQLNVPGDVHLILLHVVYGIAFIAGTTGNSLVILAVLLSKKLRTTTNAFVVNLSVADLLTCLMLPAYAIYVQALLFGIGDTLVGFWVGIVTKVIEYTTLGCSILTLMCIALNRWLLISRPLTTYLKVYTPKKIALWLVFTWVMSFVVIIIPPLVPGQIMRTFRVVMAVVMFPVPSIVIITCYALIWRRINRLVKRKADSASTHEVSNEPITHISTVTQLDGIASRSDSTRPQASSKSAKMTGNCQLIRHQTHVTKNMFYVVCAFVLCVGPSAVSLSMGIYDRASLVGEYAFAVLLFNSCINPLIYATKHRDFKTVFRCIVRRQWDNIPEPSDFLNAARRSKCCGRNNSSV